MKKIFYLIFSLIILTINQSNANECFTCQDIIETKNSCKVIIEKISGIDYLKIKTTETILEKYIKNKFDNNINISIKAKSAKALKNGEFKQIKASTPKLTYKNYTITNFEAKTLCPYNKFIEKNGQYYFPYDIPAEFSAQITNEDLNNIVSDYLYKQQNKIYINMFGINLIKLEAEKWIIENSKIRVIFDVQAPFLSSKITLSTNLKIQNGTIIFTNASNESATTINIKLNKILPYLNIYNPFCYIIKLAKNTNVQIYINDISVINDKIYLKGIFLIPKNCDITE